MSERTAGLLARIADQKRRYQTVILSHEQADAVVALNEAVREFFEAEAEVEKEATRAERNGGKGWSSAPSARRGFAIERMRAALLPVERDQLSNNINHQQEKS